MNVALKGTRRGGGCLVHLLAHTEEVCEKMHSISSPRLIS